MPNLMMNVPICIFHIVSIGQTYYPGFIKRYLPPHESSIRKAIAMITSMLQALAIVDPSFATMVPLSSSPAV